jgi:hypothetical protein
MTLLWSYGTASVDAMKMIAVISTGQTLTISAEPEDTIGDIKNYVQTVTQIFPINQTIRKDSTILDDKKTLAFYGISNGDTLSVSISTKPLTSPKKWAGKVVTTLVIIAFLGIIALMVKRKLFDKAPEI